MTFLNIAMIGGILALNIPIIIHLLNRNRPRIVRWGAMHLLEQVMRTQKRKLRLEQILLLLVRAMIPVLLAICMASPVLTGCKELAGQSRGSMVIVLDNSYSMSAGGANASHIAATHAAIEILRDLPDGSDASVIMMAGGVAPLLDEPTTRISLLIDELKKRTASYGPADVPTALSAATAILSTMSHAKKDIIIISDFQRLSWASPDGALQARLAQWNAGNTIDAPLSLLHVGKEAADNLAVMDLSLSKSIVGVGQRVNIRANIKHFGTRTNPSLRIYLEINGERREVSELSLGAGEAGQVLFAHTFDQPGSQVIKVIIDGDSVLQVDNELMASVQVLDRVPVLLIDGDPAPPNQPLKGETGFLATALEPFTQNKVNTADLLAATVIAASHFTPEMIDQQKAIVLANVTSLTAEQLTTLDGYVRGGGGLIIFLGNRVNGDWFNERLFAGGAGLAPARLTELVGSAQAVGKPTTISVQTFAHPALSMFNDRRNGDLATGEITNWFRLEPPRDAAGITTLLRFENGDPMLIEKRHGEGTVLLCATACDADWSNLPARPFYVPLMQQLISHTASSVEPPRNVQMGQPLSARLSRTLIGRRAVMTDPAGRRHAITISDQGSRGSIEFTATEQLGLYTLDFPGSEERPLHFVVRSPREESDLAQLSQTETSKLAAEMKADVIDSVEAYRELDGSRRHGSEIWHWFFWAVLVMCFVELFLQFRFANVAAARG